MRTRILPWVGVAGTASLNVTDGHTVGGTGQVLADDSAATYVNYAGAGGGSCDSTLKVPDPSIPESGLTAYVDWHTTFTGSTSESFNVIIHQGAYGNLAGWYYTDADAASRVTSLGGGWLRFHLRFVDTQGAFAEYVNAGTAVGIINCVGVAGKVYEARLVVEHPGGYPPPCRLFPREDGLGVGGGRNYPPPRSQQRSPRRFGYH